MNTPETKEQAKRLFFQSKLTRAQIAAIIGVHPRTLFDWIREGDWKSARNTAANAPMFITEQYYNQLNAMNRNISERSDRPFPTKEEADIMRKLSMTIRQVKVRQGLSETIEIFALFSNFLRYKKPHIIEEVMHSMTDYLNTLKVNITQTPIDQYNQQQEIKKDWEQYLYELNTDDDVDQLANIIDSYKTNIDKQKQEMNQPGAFEANFPPPTTNNTNNTEIPPIG